MQPHDDDDRDDFQRDANWLMLGLIGALTFACLIALFVTWGPIRAKADTLNKKPSAIKAAQVAAPDKSWTGCHVGIWGGHTVGQISGSGPIGLSSDGFDVRPEVGCDIQMGQLVVGGEVSYAFMHGDLDKIGVHKELAIGGRIGALASDNVLVYGSLQWAQLDTDFGDIKGWKVGPGVEIRLPNAKGWSVDFRYLYGTWDTTSLLPPGVDTETHTVMGALKYRLDVPKAWFGQ